MSGKSTDKILVSQQKSSKSLLVKDLGDFSFKTGSKSGQVPESPMSNQSFSLYDALRELCKEKKCLFSNRQPVLNIFFTDSREHKKGRPVKVAPVAIG